MDIEKEIDEIIIKIKNELFGTHEGMTARDRVYVKRLITSLFEEVKKETKLEIRDKFWNAANMVTGDSDDTWTISKKEFNKVID